jgi:hypothetical protein
MPEEGECIAGGIRSRAILGYTRNVVDLQRWTLMLAQDVVLHTLRVI